MTLSLAVLGAATYAISLAATIPARLVASRTVLPQEIIDISGTLWNGQAILKGGYELQWKVLPFRSLVQFSLAVDWTLEGSDTSLNGRASIWPDSATLAAVEGRAGWGLVGLALPAVSVSCDASAAVSLSRVVLRQDRQGAVGEMRSAPAVCLDTARTPPQPLEIPALTAVSSMSADGALVKVASSADPGTPLADLAVNARVLTVTVHPEGARLTNALPTSGPITLEFPF